MGCHTCGEYTGDPPEADGPFFCANCWEEKYNAEKARADKAVALLKKLQVRGCRCTYDEWCVECRAAKGEGQEQPCTDACAINNLLRGGE